MKQLFLFLFITFNVNLFSQSIDDIYVERKGNLIEISYGISGISQNQKAFLSLYCSQDGGNTWGYPLKKVSGNIGYLKSGYDKRVKWDVLNENGYKSGINSNNVVFRLKLLVKTTNTIPCDNCNGKGYFYETDDCSRCTNGYKEVKKECEYCKGVGFTYERKCPHLWKRPSSGNIECLYGASCDLCKGTGYVNYKICSHCNKTGKGGYKKVECSYCNGSGSKKVKNKCKICNGNAKHTSIDESNVYFNSQSYQLHINNQPPIITWLKPEYKNVETSNSSYKIRACIQSDNSLQEIKIYVNDSLLKTTRGQNVIYDCDKSVELVIPTNYKSNEVYITAKNSVGLEKSDFRVIKNKYGKEKPAPSFDRKLALVIGNAQYEHGVPLRSTINDANQIITTLGNSGFDIIYVKNGFKDETIRKIREFGDKLKDYNVALFYYAGHALQENDMNYIIPIDAYISYREDISMECISMNSILGKMKGAGTKRNIIILDACRNNPFENKIGSQNRGLTEFPKFENIIIGYAAGKGDVSIEGSTNGIYTENLLKYIGGSNYTIQEVFQKTTQDVKVQTQSKQIPWTSGNMDVFYLNK